MGDDRPVTRHLHHHVEIGRGVVQDAESHAGIVQPGGNVEIGAGGLEQSTGVVVEQDLAPAGAAGEGEHHVGGTPSQGPGAADHAIAVHLGHEADLPATRQRDLVREVGPDARGDALAQVFSSFFFAAGKSTLFRISR